MWFFREIPFTGVVKNSSGFQNKGAFVFKAS
jgi:hypothetical protein